jgi:hypothetical protein
MDFFRFRFIKIFKGCNWLPLTLLRLALAIFFNAHTENWYFKTYLKHYNDGEFSIISPIYLEQTI